MPTNFPTAIDVLINPAGTDPMSAHAAQHASANDAIEAIQAKVGVTGSTDTESLEFRVTALKGETTALDGRLDTVESVASAAMPSADHEAAHEVMGVVTAQTNPITGGLELLAGGEAIQVGGYYGDLYLDRVVSGLALPASGGLETTISPGVAYVNGARIATTGASVTLSASSDNYVDFTDAGTFVISPVSVAAAAPAMAANSIRLGYVTTNATTVTARVTAALDSLGNWMGNTVQSDACQLRCYNNATLGGAVVSLSFPAGNVMFDNAHMYDDTLPTRITIQRAGLYRVSYACVLSNGSIDSVRVRLNGSTDTRFPTLFTPSGWLTPQSSFDVYYNVGDYVECSITPNTSFNPFAYYTYFGAVRVG